MNLKDGKYKLKDQLFGKSATELMIENGVGKFTLKIGVNESFIYKI